MFPCSSDVRYASGIISTTSPLLHWKRTWRWPQWKLWEAAVLERAPKRCHFEDGYLHDKRIMDNNPILLEERDANGEFTFVKAGASTYVTGRCSEWRLTSEEMQTSSQAAALCLYPVL